MSMPLKAQVPLFIKYIFTLFTTHAFTQAHSTQAETRRDAPRPLPLFPFLLIFKRPAPILHHHHHHHQHRSVLHLHLTFATRPPTHTFLHIHTHIHSTLATPSIDNSKQQQLNSFPSLSMGTSGSIRGVSFSLRSSTATSPRPSKSLLSLLSLFSFYLLTTLLLKAPASCQVAAFALRPAAVAYPIRVAFQGEPGAYSEKALRELLGPHVLAIGKPSFEDTLRQSRLERSTMLWCPLRIHWGAPSTPIMICCSGMNCL